MDDLWYAAGYPIADRAGQEDGENVKRHLEGILTAVVTGPANVRAEGFKTMNQKIAGEARGFRNKERFKAAVYFHLGEVDLYQATVRN